MKAAENFNEDRQEDLMCEHRQVDCWKAELELVKSDVQECFKHARAMFTQESRRCR